MKYICRNSHCFNVGHETTVSDRYDGNEEYEYWGLKGFQDRFTVVTDCCGTENFDSIKEIDPIDLMFN